MMYRGVKVQFSARCDDVYRTGKFTGGIEEMVVLIGGEEEIVF